MRLFFRHVAPKWIGETSSWGRSKTGKSKNTANMSGNATNLSTGEYAPRKSFGNGGIMRPNSWQRLRDFQFDRNAATAQSEPESDTIALNDREITATKTVDIGYSANPVSSDEEERGYGGNGPRRV